MSKDLSHLASLDAQNQALHEKVSVLEEQIECINSPTLGGFCRTLDNESEVLDDENDILSADIKCNSLDGFCQSTQQEEEATTTLEVETLSKKEKKVKLYTIQGVVAKIKQDLETTNAKAVAKIEKQKAKVQALIEKTKNALEEHKNAHTNWKNASKLSKTTNKQLAKTKKSVAQLKKLLKKSYVALKKLIVSTKIAKGELANSIVYKKKQQELVENDLETIKTIQHHIQKLINK
jgi:hypothetical protein